MTWCDCYIWFLISPETSQNKTYARIYAVYLCLIHKTLLETVPVHWAACFVTTITHSDWLLRALEKVFIVMPGYVSHIWHTSITQFDRIFL